MLKKMICLFRQGLEHKHIALILAMGSVLLAFGSLWIGLDMDDFIQRVYLLGSDTLRQRGLVQAQGGVSFWEAVAHYFTFFSPRMENHIFSMKEFGNVPWWFYEGAQLSFFRPLASATHWLDFHLFAEWPWLMHLHSLIWAAALVFVVTKVYQRFFVAQAAWVAGFAGVLYVLDFSRLRPVTWIANRNALMATLFGFLVLLMHDRWRKGKGGRYGVLASLFLVLALLSAEAGIGVLAFLVAYALCIEAGTVVSRIKGLIPTGVVIVGWRVLYKLLAYGAENTRMYIDPVRDPLEFLTAFWQRAPQLIAGHFLGIDNFSMSFSLNAVTGIVLACIVFVVFLIWQFWPLLKHDNVARFWLISLLLSVVPVSAYGVPQGRLLSFAAVAGYGLVAQLIVLSLARGSSPYSAIQCRLGIRKGVSLFFIGMLVFMQLMMWGVANLQVFKTLNIKLEDPEKAFKSWVRVGIEPDITQKTVVIMNSPDAFSFVYVPFELDYYGLPMPSRIRILSGNASPITVTRVDERTLKVRPEAGFLPDTRKPIEGAPKDLPAAHFGHVMHKLSQGYRDERNPMRVGERVALSNMTVEITEVSASGLPVEAKFVFDTPLEDASFKWLYWNWDNDTGEPHAQVFEYLRYKAFTPPAIGESVRLRGPFH